MLNGSQRGNSVVFNRQNLEHLHRSESKSSERKKQVNYIKSRAQMSKSCTLISCFPPPALYAWFLSPDHISVSDLSSVLLVFNTWSVSSLSSYFQALEVLIQLLQVADQALRVTDVVWTCFCSRWVDGTLTTKSCHFLFFFCLFFCLQMFFKRSNHVFPKKTSSLPQSELLPWLQQEMLYP